jgi:hypothetical protein
MLSQCIAGSRDAMQRYAPHAVDLIQTFRPLFTHPTCKPLLPRN